MPYLPDDISNYIGLVENGILTITDPNGKQRFFFHLETLSIYELPNGKTQIHDDHGTYLTFTPEQLVDLGLTVGGLTESIKLSQSVSTATGGTTVTSGLLSDAWGRPKTIVDKSLFHGMFTYNVPVTMWYERFNDVERVFTNASSADGALELLAGGTLNDKTNLRTFRNLRYEPNRGHLYSNSTILPNPTSIQKRKFGLGTNENGVYFSLESGVLYGVVKTTTVGGGTVEDKTVLDTTGVDLSKGNIYDFQFQWRGVGDYKFFINLAEVGKIEYLGTLTTLSVSNPSLPLFFENENLGDNEKIIIGCVDVTSEGGVENGKSYGSVGISNESGQVSITGFNAPIIAVRSKLTVGGLINTRDTLALLASSYSDQKSFVRIWATRDFTTITENDDTWNDFGDGHLEYIERDNGGLTGMSFDTTGLFPIFGSRVGQDNTYSTSALFEGRTSIYLTPGEMFIFTMHRENGGAAKAGVTFEFAEEI